MHVGLREGLLASSLTLSLTIPVKEKEKLVCRTAKVQAKTLQAKREMAGILYLTNHWIFSPQLSCNDVIFRIKSNAVLITWFGAAVGQIQHTGAWKVGLTPRPIRHKCPHWLQWNSTAMEPFDTKSSCSQWGHAHSGNIWKAPPFWGSDSPLCGFAMWESAFVISTKEETSTQAEICNLGSVIKRKREDCVDVRQPSNKVYAADRTFREPAALWLI